MKKPMKATDIGEGEGMIAEQSGHRVAVCRVSNTMHVLSARCTHAGCEVEWNKEEQTWDCPCHGSVYTADGSVVNGPAEEPLPKAPVQLEDDSSRSRAGG